MSVYKVISNYYNDLLNFLRVEESKHGGLPNMFHNITADKKKVIVSKLADMMVRFDIAFNGEMQYWLTNRKEQSWYMAIYVIMILITFVLIAIWFFFRLKEIRALGGTMYTMLKSLLGHLVVYQVIFSVFLILILNIRSTKRLCSGQVALLKDDLKMYSNHVFVGAQRESLSRFFTFLGYWRRNSPVRYKVIFKELKADSAYDGLLGTFNVDAKTSKAETKASENPDAAMKLNQTGKEVEIYDQLRGDIESSLLRFYNNGEGYIEVKKLILLSSPILMLKEAKRIMGYYYLLGYKKSTTDEQTMKNVEKKTREIIDEVVITPINDMLKDADTSSQEIDQDKLTELVLLNEQDEDYRKHMNNLLQAFIYTSVFAYPIHSKVSDTDPSFPLPQILPFMPQKINVEKYSGEEKEFYTGLRNVFSKIYSTEYSGYIRTAQTTNEAKPIIVDMCRLLIPMFKEVYFRVFMHLKGGIWFPFNRTYMINRIYVAFQTSSFLSFSDEYKKLISEVMYDTIVKGVAGNFDILSVQRGTLVEDISNDLLPTKINVVQYQNYIINTMITANPVAQRYVDEVVELLNQVQKSVSIKKQVQANLILTNEHKFNEPSDFNELVNNLSFQDMYDSFETEFYKDVVDKFYANISESVNLKTANLRNIYYQRQKSFRIWKTAIIMMIITMILLFLRFIMGLIDEKKKILYLPPERDCDRLFAERDFRNRKTNWYIKLLLPFFLMVFIIAMLISFQKKMQYAFDFNLEVIENNTNELKNLLDDFSRKLNQIMVKLDEADKQQKIGTVQKITDDDKKEILDYVKNIIDKFEKCNYIVESSKNQIPFPYTEVIMNGFMMAIALIAILYVLGSFAPIKRLKDVKYLNKMKEELLVTDDIRGFSERLQSMGTCHNEEMDGIVWGLKLIFFTFIILFLMFYSVKIISTANDFKFGLYNSTYYEESQCYNN